MFAIMMASLPFLSGSIAAFASYYTAAFFQAFLHRLLGHHKVGGKLFTVHTGSHHTIYSGDRMLMDDYAPEEKSLSAIFVLPAILVTLLAYWALPVRLFIISVITLAISFAVHIYVHAQYHLTNTRLARFQWFRRKQQLHFVHHRDRGANFAVLEFLWDRVMRTYVPIDDRK